MPSALLEQASSFAGQIDLVIDLIFVLVGFWFILTEGIFLWLIFKYRARDGVRAEYITGDEEHPKKLITWAHMAVLVCDVVILVFAVQTWYTVKQDLPPAEKTIRVIGQQWAWTFEHPGPDGKLGTDDDIRLVDELHLAVDTLYHFELESKDVLHSFSIPDFRLKQDAIPGRIITGWFEPTKVGDYDFQCAEICGIGHGLMAAKVFVRGADEHMAWARQQAAPRLAALSLR